MRTTQRRTRPPTRPRRAMTTCSLLDLGSNSFHMVVAQRVLEQVAGGGSPARDRAHGRRPGRIRWHVLRRRSALACLSRFGQRIADIPPQHVRAVATNTVRQLRMPGQFLVPAEAALGHAIEVISGREEARLVYLGVAHAQPPKDGQLRLVIDIGGGSTECIIGPRRTAAGARKACRPVASPAPAASSPMAACPRKREGRADRNHRRGSSSSHPRIAAWAGGRGDRFVRHQQGDRRDLRRAQADQGRGHRRGAAAGARTPAAGRPHRTSTCPACPPTAGRSSPAACWCWRRCSPRARPAAHAGEQGRVARRRALRPAGPWRRRRSGLGGCADAALRDRCRAGGAGRSHRTLRLFDQVAIDWALDGDDRRTCSRAPRACTRSAQAIAHSDYHVHGAYILEHSDIAGFSQQEQRVLAALIRTHRRGIPKSAFEQIPDRLLANTRHVAALLRLAVLLPRARDRRDAGAAPAGRRRTPAAGTG